MNCCSRDNHLIGEGAAVEMVVPTGMAQGDGKRVQSIRGPGTGPRTDGRSDGRTQPPCPCGLGQPGQGRACRHKSIYTPEARARLTWHDRHRRQHIARITVLPRYHASVQLHAFLCCSRSCLVRFIIFSHPPNPGLEG